MGHGRGTAAGRRDPPLREDLIYDVAFSPDGKTLAAGHGRGDGIGGVVLWEFATSWRLTEQPLDMPKGMAFDLVFSPDGKTLASNFHNALLSGVMLWDVVGAEVYD